MFHQIMWLIVRLFAAVGLRRLAVATWRGIHRLRTVGPTSQPVTRPPVTSSRDPKRTHGCRRDRWRLGACWSWTHAAPRDAARFVSRNARCRGVWEVEDGLRGRGVGHQRREWMLGSCSMECLIGTPAPKQS
jgi:hypothetical protein